MIFRPSAAPRMKTQTSVSPRGALFFGAKARRGIQDGQANCAPANAANATLRLTASRRVIVSVIVLVAIRVFLSSCFLLIVIALDSVCLTVLEGRRGHH